MFLKNSQLKVTEIILIVKVRLPTKTDILTYKNNSSIFCVRNFFIEI